MAKYYTLVTDVGRAKMANAQVMGEKVSFSQIALGSSETKPRENQTALGKEEWRGPINNVSIDKGNPNWIVVEAVVPSNVGGFEIAEVGVYDEEGHLIVVGNHPKTYKPKMDEGTTKDVAIRIIIEVSNSEIVELKVDPSVVIATRKYVESAIELAMASIDFSAVEKQINQHVSNADIHVTAQDKNNWNAKETPSAAQAKATKALEDAKAYTDKQIDAIPEVDTSYLETKEDAGKKLDEAKSYTDIKADEALKQAKQHAEQIGENVLKDAKAYTQESASTLDLSNNPQIVSTQEKITQVEKILEEQQVDYVKHPGYAHTTGTNTYSVNLSPAPEKLVDGMGIVIRVGTSSTGKCRLNVNGLGAKDIRTPDGEDVEDLVSGGVYTVRYNGSAFILQGEGGGKGVDVLEIFNWLMTTSPFKEDGYHIYDSETDRLVIDGGNGFPNGKRIFDTSGNLLHTIMNSTNFNWVVTSNHVIKYNEFTKRVIAIDMNGNELFNVAHSGGKYVMGVSVENDEIVTYETGRQIYDIKVVRCHLNGSIQSTMDALNTNKVNFSTGDYFPIESVLIGDNSTYYGEFPMRSYSPNKTHLGVTLRYTPTECEILIGSTPNIK